MEIFKKKKSKTLIWGLRVLPEFRSKWQIIAGLMGIPANRLVQFILNDWASDHQDILLDDAARGCLARIINKAYIDRKLN